MKKIILFYSLILTLFNLPSSVNGDYFDFYSDNRPSIQANSRGYTGVADICGISNVVLNPASLDIENKAQIHFEYIYKNTVPWITEDMYLKPLYPTFLAGCGISISKYFQTGVVYYVKSSYQFEIKTVLTTPEGSKENLYQSEEEKISSLLIPIVFNYKNIRFGINFDYLNYVFNSIIIIEGKENYNYTSEARFEKLVPKFGVIFSLYEELSIGLTFVPEMGETKKLRQKSNISDESVIEKQIIFPLKLSVGIKYKSKVMPIVYYIDCNYSNESKVSDDCIDRIDFHFGLDYDKIIDKLTLRTGIFTQRDYRNEDIKKIFGSIDQIFTTFGLSYKIGVIELNLSIMDSHLFSIGKIKQTYVNSGLSWNF